jgi:predicted alpha/beta-hydrolase family hydrolase
LPRKLSVTLEGGAGTTALLYPAESDLRRPAALIVAHGAGAGQQHPFLVSFARGLSRRGVDVVTFNFFYTEQKRRLPDKMPQLVVCYRGVIAAARERVPSAREHLFIGGKSMGGRVATHVAVEDSSLPISGIVLLGYPLHPPGQPDKTRDAHLPRVKRPMLFVQGSRDTLGTPSELKPILGSLDPLPTLHTVHGGDHSFKVPGRGSAQKQAAVYDEVADTIVEWMSTAAQLG